MQQCSITLTLTFIVHLRRIIRSSRTEQNSQVGGFGPKFGQNLNLKNIGQFFSDATKLQ
jgi:hypothetical protein